MGEYKNYSLDNISLPAKGPSIDKKVADEIGLSVLSFFYAKGITKDLEKEFNCKLSEEEKTEIGYSIVKYIVQKKDRHLTPILLYRIYKADWVPLDVRLEARGELIDLGYRAPERMSIDDIFDRFGRSNETTFDEEIEKEGFSEKFHQLKERITEYYHRFLKKLKQ